MEPASMSAGGLGTGSTGLKTHLSAKKNHMDSIYFYNTFHKKPKKPVASDTVDLFVGSLSIEDFISTGVKPIVSWGSEISSVASSANSFSDIENIKNTIVEEISYTDSDTSFEYKSMSNTTSKKTQTHTYVLKHLLKQSSFNDMSNNDSVLELSLHTKAESNQMSPFKSRVLDTHSFNLTKSFILNIKLFAVSGKSVGNKLISTKNFFYRVDGFGKASIFSIFLEIIRSSFTSEMSLKKAKELAVNEKILVNDDFESLDIASLVASKWLVVMKKDLVHVTLAIFLYTLSVRTTAHNLSGLLELYDRKTCFIGHNSSSYVYNRCTIVCFVDKASKLATIGSILVFKSVNLCWTGLFLACCTKCKQFGYISNVCLVDQVCLANIYKKKQILIVCPVSFGGKTWAQIADGFFFHVVLLVPSGTGSLLSTKLLIMTSNSFGDSCLTNHMVSLECFLELLSDQVSDILRKLSFVKLVSMSSISCIFPLAITALLDLTVNSDMAVDSVMVLFSLSLPVVEIASSEFSLSSSKILITKVGGLKPKIIILEVSVSLVLARLDSLCFNLGSSGCIMSFVMETKLWSSVKLWITNKFEGMCVFTSGLDKEFFGTEMAVIMNNFFVHHVFKVKKISGQVILVWLLFKDKISVMILGLYTGASSETRFGQALAMNSLITKAVNSSTFVVLSGNFNKNGSGKSVSFKFCLDLGLVNLFTDHCLIKTLTWCNSREVEKTIDYIFVSKSLLSAITGYQICSVSSFFDTNYNAVLVSVGLGGLLDVCLNSLHKQTNKNHWKFKIKDMVVGAANEIFTKHWFSEFQCLKNKHSSKFLELELLIAKIVKYLSVSNILGFDYLIEKWSFLDADKALMMFESKLAKEVFIRKVIEKWMEKFCSDKDGMIRSILDQSFCKIVLDHLVVDDKLVLEPEKIKLNVDRIMESWIRKQIYQYVLLDYVKDNAFSGVMCPISISKLLLVVNGLPDGKIIGLSGIPNKLAWVSMIPKPYDWDEILTNIWPIALIETTRKILSKIISNKILFTCSKFGVVWSNNFSVLKDMSTQFPVFVVGLVIENALKKDWELWLASLKRIKMCNRFIKFFGNIHTDKFNRIITGFGLLEGYRVHNRLDQGEVFFPLLWRIFYNSLLCEFVARTDRIENSDGLSLFFAVDAFVDDTIWIGDCLAFMQYALNIASKFFLINDICINTKKTVVISINQDIKSAALSINGQPISMVRKGKAYRYLGIFLSTERLFKPSLVRTHANVYFFVNVVLKKAIMDKQFSYLVLADLKSKGYLLQDFSNEALHYPSFYGLKFFKQVQLESKLAAVVLFSNAPGILSWLFHYKFLDLQVLGNAGSDSVVSKAAAYFLALNMNVGIVMHGLVSFTMTELQTVALSLKCMLFFCSLVLYLNSQAVINACVLKVVLAIPDFYNKCWIEKRHIFNLIRDKDLIVCWVKIKSYSGVCDNNKIDAAAGVTADSSFYLLTDVHKHFLMAEDTAVSGNARHFVKDVFQWLFVTVRKKLYDRNYPGVLYLLYNKVELSDHVFTCSQDIGVQSKILAEASTHWTALAGVLGLPSSSVILRILSSCLVDSGTYAVVYKKFVLRDWLAKTIEIFDCKKRAVFTVINL
ncbi:hypothetical protein G9A89_018371 [Geosiphon pyriformis]|nr:hypothetical protein G9A89_018371 [Geosiphon pyriformis]